MKIKKIILILLMIIIGVSSAKAANDEGPGQYTATKNAFKLIAAINYYHQYDSKFYSANEISEAKATANSWLNGINCESNCIDYIYTEYPDYKNAFVERLFTSANLQNADNQPYIYDTKIDKSELAKKSLKAMYSDIKAEFKRVAEKEDKIKDYEATIEKVETEYSSFCEYLENHKPLKYYISKGIDIIKYVAIALVIILGALDFFKAISSGDDAALKKAFQAFMKRLVALALILVVNVIVTFILGNVSIPNYDAAQVEFCESFKF